MVVQLNHTIVWAHDKHASAAFLADVLGLAAPTRYGSFVIVQVDNDVSLDFLDVDDVVHPQHYAFIVSEAEFDEIFERIRSSTTAVLGRSWPRTAGRDQHQGRRSRRVLGRPQRPPPRDHHAPLRRLRSARTPRAAALLLPLGHLPGRRFAS